MIKKSIHPLLTEWPQVNNTLLKFCIFHKRAYTTFQCQVDQKLTLFHLPMKECWLNFNTYRSVPANLGCKSTIHLLQISLIKITGTTLGSSSTNDFLGMCHFKIKCIYDM